LVPDGTVIVTSGLGGVFPRGIPLGSVIGMGRQAEGWERTYLLRPAAAPASVSHVMILVGPRPSATARGTFDAAPGDAR
jgi:rod shape-determining protein MreC